MDKIEVMRAFAAVVDAGSFTGAAEKLGTSPQLVSKYVRALEDDLGAALLTRTTRQVGLTETGRAFQTRCTRLLEDYDNLRSSVRDKHQQPRGHLFITCPTTFGELYVIRILSEFTDLYPEITIELDMTDRFAGLIDEGFDLAIRIGKLEDSSLIARRIAPADIVACASPAYFEKHGRPERPSALQDHECIIDTNFRNRGQWPFVVDGDIETVRVDGRFRVNSATAARKLARDDKGIALCPAYVVGEDVRTGALETVLDDFNAFDLGIYAVYLENRHLSAKIRVFVDFIADRLRKMGL
ncbi:MAG: LysR family transcriptional regulator [Pseudomonadota bacterium]